MRGSGGRRRGDRPQALRPPPRLPSETPTAGDQCAGGPPLPSLEGRARPDPAAAGCATILRLMGVRIPGTSLELARREPTAGDYMEELGYVVAETDEPAPPAVSYADAPAEYAAGDGLSGIAGLDGSGSWYLDELAGGFDSNPELLGRLKYPVYREMRLSDPAVRSLEWMFKLPIRSADHGVNPNQQDPEKGGALLRADFIAKQFGLERHEGSGRLDLTYDELNQQDLLYLSYGAQGAELVWADLETWIDEEGGEHPGRFFSRLMPIMAATVQDIELDKQSGLISRVRQDIPGADWIPGPAADRPKLHWLVNEKEGANWFGQSLLRASYGAWRIKKALLVSGAISFDRWASGIPLVYHPPGKTKEAQRIGRNLRTHERAWVAVEGPPAEFGGDWQVGLLKGADSIADPVNFLRHLDGQIAMAGLQQFSSLGTTERGSRAVGDVLVEPYYMAVGAIADYMRLSRMRWVVRRLIDVNWGPQYPAPELTIEKIQGKNVGVLAAALANLTTAGFTFTDRDTQNDVRDLLDLRRLPEPVAGAIDGLPGDVGVAAEGGSIIGAGALSREEFVEALAAERRTVVSMMGDRIAASLERVFAARG